MIAPRVSALRPGKGCERLARRLTCIEHMRGKGEMGQLKVAGAVAVLALLAACQPPPPPAPSAAVPPPAPQTMNVVDHGGRVPPPVAPTVEEGYRVAIYVCSECHVVAVDQRVPPRQVPQGPTFMSIADNPDLTVPRLREHLLYTHRTTATPSHMPNPHLYDFEINEVIAYIRSLRTTP